MIKGACRFVIEDRSGITGARWSPDGAEVILKIRAVVVNGDPGDYMRYYKERYRGEHHLARYDEDTIDRLNLPQPRRMTGTPRNNPPLRKTHPLHRRFQPPFHIQHDPSQTGGGVRFHRFDHEVMINGVGEFLDIEVDHSR